MSEVCWGRTVGELSRLSLTFLFSFTNSCSVFLSLSVAIPFGSFDYKNQVQGYLRERFPSASSALSLFGLGSDTRFDIDIGAPSYVLKEGLAKGTRPKDSTVDQEDHSWCSFHISRGRHFRWERSSCFRLLSTPKDSSWRLSMVWRA